MLAEPTSRGLARADRSARRAPVVRAL